MHALTRMRIRRLAAVAALSTLAAGAPAASAAVVADVTVRARGADKDLSDLELLVRVPLGAGWKASGATLSSSGHSIHVADAGGGAAPKLACAARKTVSVRRSRTRYDAFAGSRKGRLCAVALRLHPARVAGSEWIAFSAGPAATLRVAARSTARLAIDGVPGFAASLNRAAADIGFGDHGVAHYLADGGSTASIALERKPAGSADRARYEIEHGAQPVELWDGATFSKLVSRAGATCMVHASVPAAPSWRPWRRTLTPYLGLLAVRATPAGGGFIYPLWRAVLSKRTAGQADAARVWIAGGAIVALTHDGHRGDWYENETDAFTPTPFGADVPACP